MKKKSELEGFTFGFPEGTERRGVDSHDNVVWDNGRVCVAVLHEGKFADARRRFRMDFGDEHSDTGGYIRKHSEYFSELDPMLFRCIALQWVTHGGNIEHD